MSNKELIPKISLIIPVYNVEAFLRKCLESVERQTFKDIEVIMVNDGSTDKSIEIMEEFKSKHENFKLINQENMGLSAARNTGLKEAKGEYVAFLDSDDFIADNFLEYLYSLAKRDNSDIVYCNYKIYYPESNIGIAMPFSASSGVYNKEKALKTLILDMNMHYYSWNKLYKRELFENNKIGFYDMFFEDIATTPRVFYFANKISVSSKPLYYYTRRKGSILHTMNVKKVNDYTTALGVVRNFLQKQGEFEKYKRILRIYAIRVALVNLYSIFDMHLRGLNFRGFFTNIKYSNNSIRYFVSDKFVACDKVIMPYKIKEPRKSKKADKLGSKLEEGYERD